MSAGDVLLFHRPTTWAAFRADKQGTIFTALIHLTTHSKWNHAALDVGDGMMVEATSSGVRVNPLRSSDEIRVVPMGGPLRSMGLAFTIGGVPVNPCRDGLVGYHGNDLEEVLAWATGRVGNRYGYLTAFFCGLRNLFPGWSVVQDKAFICSQLVAESLERAGHDFGKSTEKVSPGDLATHFGVPR